MIYYLRQTFIKFELGSWAAKSVKKRHKISATNYARRKLAKPRRICHLVTIRNVLFMKYLDSARFLLPIYCQITGSSADRTEV